MSGSSFVVPSAVFSGLSALSGPVAVVGSRSLPSGALLSVARFGRWVGRSRPLWSGGALGVDSAASAGALAQGGQVCWWLPAGFGELAAGSSSPVVRGPGGVFPVSAPRQLARSPAWFVGLLALSPRFMCRMYGDNYACICRLLHGPFPVGRLHVYIWEIDSIDRICTRFTQSRNSYTFIP